MRLQRWFALFLFSVISIGCAKEKTTAELVGDLKSKEEKARVSAVRLLPEQEGDAAQVIPALIQSLKDKDGHVRRSAALGLGQRGAEAREAIPNLQGLLKDHDPRIREAAALALSRIEPTKFSAPKKIPGKKG